MHVTSQVPLDKIIAFLSRFMEPGIDPLWSREHFEWKMDHNPYGVGVLSYATIKDEVVAVFTTTARKLWINGEIVTAYEAGDAYTCKRFRGLDYPYSSTVFHVNSSRGNQQWRTDRNSAKKSIFMTLLDRCCEISQQNGARLIFGTPNKYSNAAMCKRCGFRPHQNVLCSIGMAFTEQHRLEDSDYNIEKAEFSLTIDNFKELLRSFKIAPFFRGISIVRDESYYRYRFLDNPLANYSVLIVRENRNIIGSVIMRRHIVYSGRFDCCFADWHVSVNEGKYYRKLFTAVLNHLQGNRPLYLTALVVCGSDAMSAFESLGFHELWRIPLIFKILDASVSIYNYPVENFTIACSDNI